MNSEKEKINELYKAIKSGELEEVKKKLTDKTLDINTASRMCDIDSSNCTLLGWVAESIQWSTLVTLDSYKEIITLLINHPRFNLLENNTQLHDAVGTYGSFIVEKLIQKAKQIEGVELDPWLNSKTQKHITPLGVAVKNANIEAVQCLTEAGADVDQVFKSNIWLHTQLTPLYEAVLELTQRISPLPKGLERELLLDTCCYLIQNGANIHFIIDETSSSLSDFIQRCGDQELIDLFAAPSNRIIVPRRNIISTESKILENTLSEAILDGQFELVVKYLSQITFPLSIPCRFNYRRNGGSPLYYAISRVKSALIEEQSIRNEIALEVLSNPHTDLSEIQNLLPIAAKAKCSKVFIAMADTLKTLKNYHPSWFYTINNDGRTLLHEAAYAGNNEVVTYLLNEKFDMEVACKSIPRYALLLTPLNTVGMLIKDMTYDLSSRNKLSKVFLSLASRGANCDSLMTLNTGEKITLTDVARLESAKYLQNLIEEGKSLRQVKSKEKPGADIHRFWPKRQNQNSLEADKAQIQQTTASSKRV